MAFNLRTTICINMLVIMIAAIGLISVVIFRVSEQEIRRQQQHAAEQTFIAIETTLGAILRDTSTGDSESFNLNSYLDLLASTIECDILIVTDRNNRVLASAGQAAQLPGPHAHGNAVPARTRTHSLQRDSSRTVVRHLCSGPVIAGSQVLGYLTIGFPAEHTNARVSSAARMIILYMVIDAIIIFCFGMFLLSLYVVRPVRRLTRDMHALAGGVLPDTQPSPPGNEIDSLAATLKALYTGLKQEQHNTAEQLAEITAKNRQLEQARHEILQSEKMASVGRLAAGIAHEIGNPAGIVTGYIHMLKAGNITEEQREDFLERMEGEIERISSTIRELLDFARPASGQTAAVQLNDSINECVALFSYQKDAQACKVIFEPAENLPEINANARILQQLVINLMLNARDAMPGGGTITITTRLLPGDNALELTVADTGCGIAPEHTNLIFDPFFTTKEPGKGTGLGLSNAHRIVELQGGTINMESEPGRGTRFTITLPIRTEQQQP